MHVCVNLNRLPLNLVQSVEYLLYFVVVLYEQIQLNPSLAAENKASVLGELLQLSVQVRVVPRYKMRFQTCDIHSEARKQFE